MPISNKVKNILEKGVFSVGECKVKYNLTVGQPSFKTPETIKEAAKKAIDSDKNGYIQTSGDNTTKALILDNLKEKHEIVKQEINNLDAIVTSGVTGGLYCTLLACLNPAEEVIIPDPYFPLYIDMVEFAGGTPVTFSTYPDMAVTADKIKKVITNKSKILLLTSPNNPSGVVIDNKELKKICELCNKHNILIVCDEVYNNFLYTTLSSSFFNVSCNCIVLNSFSKSHGVPGWRIGYAVGPKNLIKALEVVQGNIFVNPPVSAHYSICAALNFDNKEIVKEFKKKRELVIKTLKDVCPNISCDGGYFVFFNVMDKCKISGSEAVDILLKKDVAVLPGKLFSKKDTHCRLSLTIEYDKLKEALDIIKNTLTELIK